MQAHFGVEHICLASEQGEEKHQSRVIAVSFEQRNRWRRSALRVTVFNDQRVAIERQAARKAPLSYEFDLGFLASRPRRVRRISWGLVGAALALFAAAVAVWLSTPGVDHGAFAGGLLVAGAGTLVLAAVRYRDRVIYFSKHGRAPLLILLNGKPDKQALQQFVAELSARIRASRHNWSDRQAFLSGELKEHRRLHEQGVISRADYERSKRRILRQHHPRSA